MKVSASFLSRIVKRKRSASAKAPPVRIVARIDVRTMAPAGDHAVVISANGGGYNALTNLNTSGSADRRIGFSAGYGAALEQSG